MDRVFSEASASAGSENIVVRAHLSVVLPGLVPASALLRWMEGVDARTSPAMKMERAYDSHVRLTQLPSKAVSDALQHRFGETLPVDENLAGLDELARIASRKVHRRYLDSAVDPALLRLLCACALSAPTKSDLQQADIVILDKPEQMAIADLIPDQPFIRTAPAFLVFLANGRRLAGNRQDARQAVPERPSRPVLQRRGRRRHRARDIPRAPPTRSGSAPARSA